jgi:excisionase family DNA binding protein
MTEPVASPATEPVYLTPDQVGELLQVSAKSVYRWAEKDPSMPRLKIAGTVRFPKDRLLSWLRSREQGRPPTRSLSALPPRPAPDKGADSA